MRRTWVNKRKTLDEINEAVNLVLEEGHSCREVAKALGFLESSLNRHVQKAKALKEDAIIVISKKSTNKDNPHKSFSGKPICVLTAEVNYLKSNEITNVQNDSSDVTDRDVPGMIHVNSHESPNREKEGHDSESLGLIISEPFSLKETIDINDKDFEVLNNKSDLFDKPVVVQDLIDNLVSQLHSSNVEKMPNLTIKSPTKNSELDVNKLFDSLDVNKQDISEKCNELTSGSFVSDLDSNSNGITKRKRSINPINESPQCSSLSGESHENITENEMFNNKKVKTIEMRNEDNILYGIKPCSIILENNVANQMRPSDVCKVIQTDNLEDFVVCSRNKSNNPTSEPDINTNSSPKEETIFNEVNCTKNTKPILVICEENDPVNRAASMLLEPEKASESVAIDFDHSTQQIVTTKEWIQKNFSKIVTRKVSTLVKNNKSHTNSTQKELLEQSFTENMKQPEQPVLEKRTEIKLPICDKIKETIQINEPDTNRSSLPQILESLGRNKALSIKPLPNTPLKTDFKPNYPMLFNLLNSDTSKSCSSPESNKTCNLSLVNSPKGAISDANTNYYTELKFEDMLERAPAFIQTVFKCDNIRDGFVNEDLLFVLSLLPDMEELPDTDKLKFQLRIIETINDVLTDPVLKS